MTDIDPTIAALGGSGATGIILYFAPKVGGWIGRMIERGMAGKEQKDSTLFEALLADSKANREAFEGAMRHSIQEVKETAAKAEARAERAEQKVEECEKKHEAATLELASLKESHGRLETKVEMFEKQQSPEEVAQGIAEALKRFSSKVNPDL